ncbi:MAG TPA: hypothetical protein VEC35_11360 [Noviherbaspirillum sp.]|nr:hypothetical protein [Noviherbaspirillum sp.]
MGRRNRLGAIAIAAIAASVAAGCGGGGDDKPPATLAPQAGTTAPTWTIDIPIENQSGKAEFPSVAIAANGDTIAVFAQQTGTRIAVHAVHGNAGSGRWGHSRVIDRPDTSAHVPQTIPGKFQTATQLAIQPATGDAVAVWSANGGGVAQVWAARYHRASDTWSAPVRLNASSANASYPVIAMNAQGNAVAVWSETATGGTPGVGAAYFANGAWSASTSLSTRAAGTPQAGIDAAGNALVTWTEKNAAGIDDIMVAKMNSGGVTSPARTLDTSATPASLPAITVAPNGNALVAWLQDDDTGNSVHASRLAGDAWSPPAVLERLQDDSYAPAVALNDIGGFVAWEQQDVPGASGLAYAVRLDASGTWSAPATVYNRGGYMPVIRLRDNGDAMMIWLAAHTQYATWSASASAWSAVTNLAPYNCGAGHALAMDASSGKAVAAWIPSNCARNNDVYGAFYR